MCQHEHRPIEGRLKRSPNYRISASGTLFCISRFRYSELKSFACKPMISSGKTQSWRKITWKRCVDMHERPLRWLSLGDVPSPISTLPGVVRIQSLTRNQRIRGVHGCLHGRVERGMDVGTSFDTRARNLREESRLSAGARLAHGAARFAQAMGRKAESGPAFGGLSSSRVPWFGSNNLSSIEKRRAIGYSLLVRNIFCEHRNLDNCHSAVQ